MHRPYFKVRCDACKVQHAFPTADQATEFLDDHNKEHHEDDTPRDPTGTPLTSLRTIHMEGHVLADIPEPVT